MKKSSLKELAIKVFDSEQYYLILKHLDENPLLGRKWTACHYDGGYPRYIYIANGNEIHTAIDDEYLGQRAIVLANDFLNKKNNKLLIKII